jgi:hypothetical protein
MKPTTTPSANADPSDVIGRSEMKFSTWSSCSPRVSPSSFRAALIWSARASPRFFEASKDAFACRIEQARDVALQRLQFIPQFA